jgi:hypothetical protein
VRKPAGEGKAVQLFLINRAFGYGGTEDDNGGMQVYSRILEETPVLEIR